MANKPFYRRVDELAVTSFPIAWLGYLAAHTWTLTEPIAASFGAVLGWACADLVSGFIHWLGDHILPADAPLVGKWLVQSFAEHHDRPQSICEHGQAERNGGPCVGGLIVLAGGAVGLKWFGTPGGVSSFLYGWLAALSVGAAATNQFHHYAHLPSKLVPHPVLTLQRLGLIVSPRIHGKHHSGPHADSFCITTGWCNRLLDGILKMTWSRLRGESQYATKSIRPIDRLAL